MFLNIQCLGKIKERGLPTRRVFFEISNRSWSPLLKPCILFHFALMAWYLAVTSRTRCWTRRCTRFSNKVFRARRHTRRIGGAASSGGSTAASGGATAACGGAATSGAAASGGASAATIKGMGGMSANIPTAPPATIKGMSSGMSANILTAPPSPATAPAKSTSKAM